MHHHKKPAGLPSSPALAFAFLVAAGAGCVGDPGVIGGSGSGGSGPGTGGTGSGTGGSGGPGSGGAGGKGMIAPPPSGLPTANACATNVPGPRFVRRLSVAEFDATVRDLFKDPAMTVGSVFDDPEVLGFHGDSNAQVVRDLGAQRVRDNAEEIAHWAATNKLSQLSSCSTMDATCRKQFITSFGKRAFRAPLADERVAAYDALFAMETTFADGVEAVVTAMLQSPNFLYRTELGPDATAGTVALTQYEIASELSYLLWGTMPDDTLMAAADAGMLSTAAQVEQQTDRMLGDPRSADALMRFATDWLQLGRLQTNVKDSTFMLTDALRADMLGETRALILDTFNTSGGLPALLTGNYSFLNRNLANHYGIGAAGIVDNVFNKIPYGTSIRRDPGLLAHASILSGHAIAAASSPTQRGKLVRTRLLCLEVPPMPADLDTTLRDPPVPGTTRQKYTQHSTNAKCAGCHLKMDPIGFGFEHYDGVGRYRDQDNGMTVDVTGSLNSVREGDVAFNGLGELSKYVANSDDAKTCLIRYWSYQAYGAVSWAEDACTYDSIRQSASPGGFALKGVLKGIIQAPHFSRRVRTP